MKAWKRIEPTGVVKAKWRSIIIKNFRMPDGSEAQFDTYFTENQRYAGVVALTPDKQVIVARQFRPGPEEIWDDIPGGGVNEGEDPQVAAKRELLEETGCKSNKVTLLGSTKRDAYFNAEWFYYLAEDCYDAGNGQSLDANEYVEVVRIPISEFIENALAGKMSDSHAVLLAYDKLRQLEGEG